MMRFSGLDRAADGEDIGKSPFSGVNTSVDEGRLAKGNAIGANKT